MNKLSLFSGIGGIDLAAEWAGMTTVAFCEREPFPQRVLRKHWPNVPIYDDVCTLSREVLERDGIIGPGRAIDIISAGYPCQPFSNAGKRRGAEDDRHLWPEVKRLLSEIRPRWFVGENVAGHITLGLDDVLIDLESIGYTAQPVVIPACAVGAPNRRDRVFIVAYSEGDFKGRLSIGTRTENTRLAFSGQDVADTTGAGLSQRRQSGLSQAGTEAESGMEPESERCGEILADAPFERGRGLSIFAGGSQQADADPYGCSKNVGNADGINAQGEQPIWISKMGRGNSTGNIKGQVLEPNNNGQLNPDWVECLMGFPIGWTDINGPQH